jgi:hypothetical protein
MYTSSLANTDSLAQRLWQNPDDTTCVQLYLKLTWAYKDSSPEKSEGLIQKAKKFAETSAYTVG